jgi:hypothetical protein
MMGNGKEDFEMVTEPKYGQIQQSMMGIGKKEELMAKELSLMLMEINTLETGCMTKQMDLEGTNTQTVPLMKESGETIYKRERVKSNGRMALYMKGSTKKVRNMDWVLINGMTKASILENGMTTKSLESEDINGLMAECIQENGLITTWKDMDFTTGMMEERL